MTDREKRTYIFYDTIDNIYANEKLRKASNNSIEKTRLYNDMSKYNIVTKPNCQGKITVINSRSFEASKGYSNIAVLNFASATTPGGGVKTGSAAQEECLCRCSTLYLCLTQENLRKDFYGYHRSRYNNLYSNKIIYSKDIVVFKSDIAEPEMLDENDWYNVDIITCAAPNLRDGCNIEDNELYCLFRNRIECILKVAIENGNKNIVLGAFGCGAFKNPPKLVAEAFNDELKKYRYYFDNIIFAVYSPADMPISNFEIFDATITK